MVKTSNTIPQFDIVRDDPAKAHPLLQGWIQRPVALEIFRNAGLDFEAQKKRAQTPGFTPVDLKATLSADFEVDSGCVAVVVSVAGRPGVTVDRTGLPWVMLSAIDPEAEVRSDDGVLAIAISRRREELRR